MYIDFHTSVITMLAKLEVEIIISLKLFRKCPLHSDSCYEDVLTSGQVTNIKKKVLCDHFHTHKTPHV